LAAQGKRSKTVPASPVREISSVGKNGSPVKEREGGKVSVHYKEELRTHATGRNKLTWVKK